MLRKLYLKPNRAKSLNYDNIDSSLCDNSHIFKTKINGASELKYHSDVMMRCPEGNYSVIKWARSKTHVRGPLSWPLRPQLWPLTLIASLYLHSSDLPWCFVWCLRVFSCVGLFLYKFIIIVVGRCGIVIYIAHAFAHRGVGGFEFQAIKSLRSARWPRVSSLPAQV